MRKGGVDDVGLSERWSEEVTFPAAYKPPHPDFSHVPLNAQMYSAPT